MNKPYIRSLNSNQYKLLVAIYSFRFSTRSLLSEYCGVPNNTSFYSRLQILQKHDYIAAHYGKDYRLAGREAEFYLLPKGMRALRDAKLLEVSDAMMTALYKDKSMGQDFIKRQVYLMRLRNKLVGAHENLQAFTARDVQALDYFPKPRPDLFLSVKEGGAVIRCFLEYIPADMTDSKLRKRLEYLMQYYEEGDWDDAGTPFPVLLFVTETGLASANLRKLLSRERYDELTVYISTATMAEHMTNNAAIWTGIENADEPKTLLEL